MSKNKYVNVPRKMNTGQGHAPAYLFGAVDTIKLVYDLNRSTIKSPEINQLCNDILSDINKEQDRLNV